jgi:Methyltransferase domain
VPVVSGLVRTSHCTLCRPCRLLGACLLRMRQRMVPLAQGVVVEVGFGSGLNLPYYDAGKVKRLIGADPDATMLALANRQNDALPFVLECLQAGAENMPLADGSADTAVVAYALCTILEPQAGGCGKSCRRSACSRTSRSRSARHGRRVLPCGSSRSPPSP